MQEHLVTWVGNVALIWDTVRSILLTYYQVLSAKFNAVRNTFHWSPRSS